MENDRCKNCRNCTMTGCRCTDNGDVCYYVPSGSVFDTLYIRNPDIAFSNAVIHGMLHPENYMYMHSARGRDYFKNCDTGKYVSIKYSRYID